MNKQGLEKIEAFIDKGEFKNNIEFLGIKIANPKQLLLNYYNQIIENKVGKRQLEACHYHCANIVMHHEGLTDQEIKDFWWSKLNKNEKSNPKSNVKTSNDSNKQVRGKKDN